ncbi:efflux RND transporter periplasmic adaptor subunit [Rubripirellula tenax]|nr:efflux RND transporter periplasmic adaptor subunit [Rubripirellula tenax]
MTGLMLTLILGCGENRSSVAVAKKPPKVIVAPASAIPMTDYDEFVGRTEACEFVEVRSRVSGFLRSVEFEDGAFVQEGQLLATVEPDQYQAIHDQSLAMVELQKTKVELAASVLARSKKLKEGSAISQEQLEEDAASLKAAEAQITVAMADAARTALDLKYTAVKAPIAGRVDRALVTAGNVVTGGLGSGTLLTTIVNDSPTYAYFDVDEASILRYIRQSKSQSAEGDRKTTVLRDLNIPVELQLKDESGFPHKGTLDFLENRIDDRTGTIRLRGVFENDDNLLRGGLFVRVRIPTSEPYEAVMIPEAAIGTDQTYKFAFVVGDDNVAQRRAVTLGPLVAQPEGGSMRVIKDGIRPGENVVVQGVQRVQPGIKVDPQTQVKPTIEPEEVPVAAGEVE